RRRDLFQPTLTGTSNLADAFLASAPRPPPRNRVGKHRSRAACPGLSRNGRAAAKRECAAAMPSSPNDFSNDHAGCRLGTALEVLATKGPRLSEHLSRLWPLRQAGRPVLISGPAPAGLAPMG